MTVHLWAGYNKAKSSTATPSTEGVSVDCTPCNPVSILSPRIKMSHGTRYNYAYIPAYNRYYFVNGIDYENGFDVYSLIVDVMGSYRAEIKTTSSYVTRCADSRRYNDNLNDTLYPTETPVEVIKTVSTAPFVDEPGYIVQFSGDYGAKTLWLYGENYNTLITKLWQDWDSVLDGERSFAQLMGNPTDNLKSIRRCALPYSAYTQLPIETAHVGIINTGATGKDVTGRTINRAVEIDVPKPDGYTARPSLLYNARYSLWLPGAGFVEIPANLLFSVDKIRVGFNCAMDTGGYTATITVGPEVVKEVQGSFTRDVQEAFQNINMGGIVSGTLSAFSAASLGNIIGTASGIVSGLSSLIPSVSSVGSTTDWYKITSGCTLQCYYQLPAGEDVANRGRPCCKVLTLGNCSGYVKCENPNFTKAEITRENDLVNAYLTEGAYIV